MSLTVQDILLEFICTHRDTMEALATFILTTADADTGFSKVCVCVSGGGGGGGREIGLLVGFLLHASNIYIHKQKTTSVQWKTKLFSKYFVRVDL